MSIFNQVANTSTVNIVPVQGIFDANGTCLGLVGPGGEVFTPPFSPANFEGSTAADTPLVQITQTGAGYALLVEDSANPDATPFVVHASGGVSVGNAIDAGAGNLFVLGNIGATIISALQEMTIARSGGGQVMQIRGSLGATNPVLTISTSDAASGVFININTVAGVATSSLAFTGKNGQTMWTFTSDGDFFPRQGTVGMKEGFAFVPGGAGAPTDVPTNENTGITPLYFDEANNRLYAYNNGWKYTQLA
jgi:hypothetical protein